MYPKLKATGVIVDIDTIPIACVCLLGTQDDLPGRPLDLIFRKHPELDVEAVVTECKVDEAGVGLLHGDLQATEDQALSRDASAVGQVSTQCKVIISQYIRRIQINQWEFHI